MLSLHFHVSFLNTKHVNSVSSLINKTVKISQIPGQEKNDSLKSFPLSIFQLNLLILPQSFCYARHLCLFYYIQICIGNAEGFVKLREL